MKILHVSTLDLAGGAARGAYWLHRALREAGADSSMLVSDKRSDDPSVLGLWGADPAWAAACGERAALDEAVLAAHPRREAVYFSPASWTPGGVAEAINRFGADIVHLHWVEGGFVLPEDLPLLRGRLVWSLRDMWPLTGGCHYSEGCVRYGAGEPGDGCGRCPVLRSGDPEDATRRLWRRKEAAWRGLDLRVVAVSRWMADCARASRLFAGRPVDVIHNGVSTGTFSPHDRADARRRLGIPEEKAVLLYGALYSTTDARKGFQFLGPTLRRLAAKRNPVGMELLVFGASQPEGPGRPESDFPPGLAVRYLGTIKDDALLRLVYAAADVTLVPSVEDACPKVPIESMACGTPVVCFDATGMRDIVDHLENGYRARCFDPGDLAAGIDWVLSQEGRLSAPALRKARKAFSLDVQVRKHLALYREMMAAPSPARQGN